ncbi:regulating synaptic membrane exocytosis protein 1-like, partial [Mya arenaria]|uniref:regulating synaptic membrane exocytosis protein 1-like n=1 Tax=Mya arenaria TaxID=6604 RepID=UPI0022E12F80
MSTARRPSLPPMPDLSHLKEDERKIIEDVLRRQREEEEREQDMIRYAARPCPPPSWISRGRQGGVDLVASGFKPGQMQMEFDTYRQTVEKVGEEVKRSENADTGAVCDICRKTKFADGVGHKCTYCNLKSCARCGGRVTVKNKALWACNLCKKKQEILAKTGQWYHGGMARPVGIEEVIDTSQSMGDLTRSESGFTQLNDKRQKYNDKSESGHTSSEKENIDKSDRTDNNRGQMTRQGSQLRRQYSLDAQRGKTGDVSPNKDPGDRQGVQGGDRLRERGNNVPLNERGRARDKSPARHRHHSESRLSETDKRYIAHERGEFERFGGRSPREALGNRTGDNRDNKGRHPEEREPRRAPKEGQERLNPEREIIKKESAQRTRSMKDSPSPRHSIDEKSTGDERERRKEPPDRYRQSPVDNFSTRSHDRPLHDYADTKRERRGSRERVIDDYKSTSKGHASDRERERDRERDRLSDQGLSKSSHKSSLDNVSRSGSRREHRSPPQMQDRQYRSPPQHRHFIHIEQASDTQVSANEETQETDLSKQ